jgi:hypothetical protein
MTSSMLASLSSVSSERFTTTLAAAALCFRPDG